MDIPILYEDTDVVVINKPAGLMTHGDGRVAKAGRTARETVADWHVSRVPTVAGVGEPLVLPDGTMLSRPGVVHRLDAETSGVLILAKNPEAFAHLKQQFHDRLARKTYRAFVYGAVRDAHGVIDRPIGRSAKDFRLRSAQRGARGKLRDARTHWERLAVGSDYSYLSLAPETGRTHQLRVHCKAINHAIVGDRLYAPKRVEADSEALGFSRLALHAYELELELPTGERRRFIAPLPEDFLRAEARLAG